jgi:hypothetical protein
LPAERSIVVAAVAATAAVTAVAWPRAALAGPDSEVASAFDRGDKLDVHVSLEYRFTGRTASVKRELAGLPGADPDGPLPLVKDLRFSGARQEVIPRLELGVFTDLALTAALPIVIRETRTLAFDQRGSDCVFAADPGAATCIDATNSTTVADGILPPEGFDAGDPDGPGFSTAVATIFRGVERHGLDQVQLGAVWAPMNQARDVTKPTWKLGAELRLAVGRTMRLDRAAPESSDGVSRGVHEVRLYTSMARRLSWAEPFFEIWYQAPVGAKDGAPLDAPAEPFGARRLAAQQRGGGRFGIDARAWQDPDEDRRIDLNLSGNLEAHFEGRDYSDMWEVFAYAGDARVGGPLTLDRDPTASGVQAISHPGVTDVENYLTLGGRAGVDAHLGRVVRLAILFEVNWDQSHLISFADPGVDAADDDNDVVDQGTSEVNPFYAPLIDATGHRYRIDEAVSYAVSVGLRLLF